LEYRCTQRKIKLITKTKYDGVLSTKDYHVPDFVSADQVVDDLLKQIPQTEQANIVFRQFEKPVFLLEPQCFVNVQRIPEVVPFVLIRSSPAEKILSEGMKKSTEDITVTQAKSPHMFQETFFETPTWCKFCSKLYTFYF
jgi:hypothetical protein